MFFYANPTDSVDFLEPVPEIELICFEKLKLILKLLLISLQVPLFFFPQLFLFLMTVPLAVGICPAQSQFLESQPHTWNLSAKKSTIRQVFVFHKLPTG